MSKKNLFLIICAIILFIILSIAIKADYLYGFESWIYSEATEHMSDFLTTILIIITNIGGPIGIMCVCAIIFAIPKLRNRVAIPVTLAVTSSFFLNIILKQLFARERPNILRLVSESFYSFPSGHAMVNMALYSILIIYAYKLINNTKLKYSIYAILTSLILAIGFTRIYLGVHYAGDIIGGWLIGFVVSIIVYSIMKKSTILNYDKNKKQG
ncbi:MAG: phosphatase PAP2 family protein [Clostridia bacterium]